MFTQDEIDNLRREGGLSAKIADYASTRNEIKEITDELGYIDNNVVVGEIFHLWVLKQNDFIQKIYDEKTLETQNDIITLLSYYDTILSPNNKDSLVSKVNNNDDIYVNEDYANLLEKSLEISISQR